MTLREELDRCDREIEQRRAGLESGEYDDHPGGALLGLHDWYRERELILEQIKVEDNA